MAENIPQRPRRRSRAAPPPTLRPVEVPEPPEHLSCEATALWAEIVSQWELGPDGLAILRGALESWDAYQACRRQVAEDGPTFVTENGMVRQHPAAKLALDSFGVFRQAMRQLGLEPGGGLMRRRRAVGTGPSEEEWAWLTAAPGHNPWLGFWSDPDPTRVRLESFWEEHGRSIRASWDANPPQLPYGHPGGGDQDDQDDQ